MSSGRKEWGYRGCDIIPLVGKPKYFGKVLGKYGRVMYRSLYWRVNFTDGTWTYCGTKEDCIDCINQPRNDMRTQNKLLKLLYSDL
jgi:hypothetical protein